MLSFNMDRWERLRLEKKYQRKVYEKIRASQHDYLNDFVEELSKIEKKHEQIVDYLTTEYWFEYYSMNFTSKVFNTKPLGCSDIYYVGAPGLELFGRFREINEYYWTREDPDKFGQYIRFDGGYFSVTEEAREVIKKMCES